MNRPDQVFDLLVSANPDPGDEQDRDLPTFEDVLRLTTGEEKVLSLEPWRKRHRGPIVGLAAALVVIVVGITLVLLNALGTEPGPVITEVTTPPTTVTDSAEASGAGPALEWTRVEGMPLSRVDRAVWFDGAFYASGGGDQTGLFRSEDGSDWAEVASLPDVMGASSEGIVALAADSERIIVVGLTTETSEEVGSRGSRGHDTVIGAALRTAVSDDGVRWISEEIAFDIPEVGRAVGVGIDPGPVAVGPAGLLVSGSVWIDIDHELIAAEYLGIEDLGEVDFEILDIHFDEYLIRTPDGEEHAFTRAEAGLTPADLAPANLETINGFTSTSVGWHSPDGRQWTPVIREGAMRADRLDAIVAAPNGFYVGDFFTRDGATWERSDLAAEAGVLIGYLRGSRLMLREDGAIHNVDTDRDLGISAALSSDEIRAWEESSWLSPDISVGDGGVFAHTLAAWGMDESNPRVVVWSADGELWRAWSPAQFAGESFVAIEYAVVGADRVVVFAIEERPSEDESDLVIWVGIPEDVRGS